MIIEVYSLDLSEGVREAWRKWKEFEPAPGNEKRLLNNRELTFARQCLREWLKDPEIDVEYVFGRKAKRFGYGENWREFFEILREEASEDE